MKAPELDTQATLELYLVIVLGVVVLLGRRLLRFGHRGHDLPPGPPTIPLLEKLHIFPAKKAYLQYVIPIFWSTLVSCRRDIDLRSGLGSTAGFSP